ncbi:VWA domain-containing protein [Clostridium sulfidigenes]|uniref:VWA domain-containing protein n=1 Tax=Clostridium sulfidigenes TaxID=318464 RepID=UPI003F8916EA
MKKRIGYKAILCIGLILCMTATLVMTSASNASAEVATKPAFEVKINSVSPEFPKVGEDITVSGEIIPKDFEAEVPAKEIVLVLDVSGSMADNVYVNGKSSTKIAELKKAAKSFVDKMKNVPNLKIGIVAYSSNASIKKVDKEILIDANKVNELKTVIDNLKADGGTNTGEGLRKAAYLLSTSKDKDANKTVVLMSDGIPTFYTSEKYYYLDYYESYYDNQKDYYLDIENEEGGYVNRSGDGTSDTPKLKDLGYAKGIGNLIKGKKYNVFTVGYGMNDDGIYRMKEIHKSMGGRLPNGTDYDESKSFFESSNGAIDKIFSEIADKIIDSYPINNVEMHMNLKSDFSLKVGGNKVDIDNVLYKTDGEIREGKVTYTADPVTFKFVIKSEVTGQHELFAGSTVSFPWKDNEIITAPVPSISINIDKNELPNIRANLTSQSEVEAYPGDEIKVTYDVIGEDFTYEDSSNMRKKDIAIVLDVSKFMLKSGKLDEIKTALINSLINNSGLAGDNVNFSLITFNNKYVVHSELTNNRNEIVNMIQAIDIEDKGPEDNNARQIDNAMGEAKTILDGKNPDADKYMVLIASNHLNYEDKKLPDLSDEKYNIMSLNLLETGNGSLDMLHKKIGKTVDNYFISKDKNGDDIKNPLMGNLAGRIISQGRYMTYEIPTELKLNLGDNFTMVSSVKSYKDGIATIKGPTVVYESKGDGKYQANNESYKVSFTIKPKEDKSGTLSFGDNNVIAYKNLRKKEVTKGIQTPKVNLISPVIDLIHGLDNGVTSSGYGVTEGEVRIANDMKVNIASVATILSSNVNVELRINKDIDLQDLSKIKVYTLKGGNLVPMECTITSIGTKLGQNCYNIKLPPDIKVETHIVIKYQCKMPEDASSEESGSYENNIIFNKEEKTFRLKGEALPDLF